ncbi:MAG: flagellar biosynthesis protein [Halanaerobiales bacterium]|nr:flagellar biosynthesis protein [Halanaerobiales bacterium]
MKNNKNSQDSKQIKKAVALRYDPERDNAPKILANGQGELARRILETAKEHDIPIRENQDLVEVLARLNIGDEIPPELYQVLAEILSFIYKLEDLN